MKQAVIEAQGHQYLVKEGDTIEIDSLPGKKGEKVSFDQVLLIVDGDKVDLGQPLIKGAVVSGEIVEHFKGEKIRVARYRAKSRYRKVKGFRPSLTKVKILKIKSNGKK